MKIPAPLGKGGGDIAIVLDPLHKEVIIATSPGNSVRPSRFRKSTTIGRREVP